MAWHTRAASDLHGNRGRGSPVDLVDGYVADLDEQWYLEVRMFSDRIKLVDDRFGVELSMGRR